MKSFVRDILESKGSEVYAVAPNTTVEDAVMRMNRYEIGAVVVVDRGAVVGIFTERDVLTRVVAGERNPATTFVSNVMTSNPVTITPNTTIEEVMSDHLGEHYRHLPVMEGGRIVGLISGRDILRWMAAESAERAEKLEEYIESGNCVT
jgi:CBS domain-containing protein